MIRGADPKTSPLRELMIDELLLLPNALENALEIQVQKRGKA